MQVMSIIKRKGLEVPFNADKIRKAIIGANNDVLPSDRISMEKINEITSLVTERCNALSRPAHVEEIQDFVEMQLWRYGTYPVSKAFQLYRYTHTLKRESNTTDEAILSLIGNTNKEMAEENSNKNTTVASTQRDYIAGIVSRDLTTRVLLPKEISEAHESGMLHFEVLY